MRSFRRSLPSKLPSFSTSPLSPPALSPDELSSLRRLLPSLCSAGHPLSAIRLLSAALLSSPPLSSLPLPALADRLSSLPDISPSLSLLTALRFHPRRPSPLPFCSLLLSSYFRRHRPRPAAKVFAWLCRADSPCRPDAGVYGIAVRGFCEAGRGLEAVRVVREMARDGIAPAEEVRVSVCLVLFREARVQEGLDFEDAARKIDGCGDGDGIAELTALLDQIIRDWEE